MIAIFEVKYPQNDELNRIMASMYDDRTGASSSLREKIHHRMEK